MRKKNSLGDVTANQEPLCNLRQVTQKLGPEVFRWHTVNMPGGEELEAVQRELMLHVESKKRGMCTSICIRLFVLN